MKTSDAVLTVIEKNEAMADTLMSMFKHLTEVKKELERLDDETHINVGEEQTDKEEGISRTLFEVDSKLSDVSEGLCKAIGEIVSAGLMETFYYREVS